MRTVTLSYFVFFAAVFQSLQCLRYYGYKKIPNNNFVQYYHLGDNYPAYGDYSMRQSSYRLRDSNPSYYHNKGTSTNLNWIQQFQLWVLNRKVSFQNKKMLQMRQIIGQLVHMDDGFTPVNGGFGSWSSWSSSCSKTCGRGFYIRTRQCNNPVPVNGGRPCAGSFSETKPCQNGFCQDPSGVAQVQDVVKKSLDLFQKDVFAAAIGSGSTSSSSPNNTHGTKYYKSMFAIQKVIAEEFWSEFWYSITTVKKTTTVIATTIRTRLIHLEKSFFAAAKAASLTYARTTFAKCIYSFIQLKLTERIIISKMSVVTKEYMFYLQSTVGNKTMSQVLSSQGDATLIFVIDTTGSMWHEIQAAKSIAQNIISETRSFDVNYILSLFNDPGVGPVTFRSSNQRNEFVNDINRLTVSGGGDCAELTFQGMLNAIYKGSEPPKYGSPMFVFTDASAKDDTSDNIERLKLAAKAFNIKINFFTHLRGCSRGINSFKEVASSTSGHIFPLSTSSEIPKFTEFVKSSLSEETLISSGGNLLSGITTNTSREHIFNVETAIGKLTVSAKVSNYYSSQHVTLQQPNGTFVYGTFGPYERILTSKTVLFKISNPQAGAWKISFPLNAGNYDFTAEAVSREPIEFSIYFAHQLVPGNIGTYVVASNPLKDAKSTMVAQVGGINNTDSSSLTMDILHLDGHVMIPSLKLNPISSSDTFNVTFISPNTTFKVRLTGMTKTGENFQRTSESTIDPSSFILDLQSIVTEFTAVIGGGAVDIKFLVINNGVSQHTTFTCHTTLGSIASYTSSKVIYNGHGKYNYLYLKYRAPTSGSEYHGKVARITYIGTGYVTKEVMSKTINILLLNKA